jgi:predicted histone-like DNA-binding protein
MAIKIKAIEKKMTVGIHKDTYRYQMQPELYSALTQDKVIREAALRSGVSQGVMQACWDAAGEVIKAWATEGHSVALPGLGTMRFGLSAGTVSNVNDVKTGLIKTRRIVFTPNAGLKQELKDTAVQITCYDRNGDIVRRVTSTSGDVVTEPDVDSTDDNENNGSSQNGSGSNGGSSGNNGTGTVTPSTGEGGDEG